MSVLRGASLLILALSLATAGCSSSRGPSVASGVDPGAAALGVNSFLWRASLDTLAFMPLASADPFGGVIITDWYVNPEKTDERFKAQVYILDTRLRGDGINVTVYKQELRPVGGWIDAPVAAQTATDIENAILTRARQLRLSNLG